MQRDQGCVNLFLILRTLTGLVGAVVIVLIALGAWAIVSFTVPPPSKRCGTPGGPPITAPRIRLSNGSYLAYQEHGDSRQNATLKIIFQVQCCCRHSFCNDLNLSSLTKPTIFFILNQNYFVNCKHQLHLLESFEAYVYAELILFKR